MARGFVGLSGTIVRVISGGKAQERRGKNLICSGFLEKSGGSGVGVTGYGQ
tara:strand:- start:26 stop:178 length:153 start_codon:yes stop_codon:yes gene_type:complete